MDPHLYSSSKAQFFSDRHSWSPLQKLLMLNLSYAARTPCTLCLSLPQLWDSSCGSWAGLGLLMCQKEVCSLSSGR